MTAERRRALQRMADPANNASANEQEMARRLLAREPTPATDSAWAWGDPLPSGWRRQQTWTGETFRQHRSSPPTKSADSVAEVFAEIERSLPTGWKIALADRRVGGSTLLMSRDGMTSMLFEIHPDRCVLRFTLLVGDSVPSQTFAGPRARQELIAAVIDYARRAP